MSECSHLWRGVSSTQSQCAKCGLIASEAREITRLRAENEALRKLCLRWLRKWQTEMDPTPEMLEDTHRLIDAALGEQR